MLKTVAGNLRSQLARERKARAQVAEGRGYRHFAAIVVIVENIALEASLAVNLRLETVL